MLNKLARRTDRQLKAKRLGRGIGSGVGGHTVGRGQKGQKSRVGHNIPRGFEGGQVPLFKRLPQLGGFRNPTSKKIVTITLSGLNVFDEGYILNPKALLKRGLIEKLPKDGVKILGMGKLSKKFSFSGFLYTKKAQELIKKYGSKII